MQIKHLKMQDIHPYPNNPRKNDQAVDAVAESIRQCGYVAPIIVDEDGVILAGHTRYKALQALGYEQDLRKAATGVLLLEDEISPDKHNVEWRQGV